MEYDRESLRALANTLYSDDLKIENTFYLSSEFYNPTGDNFMLNPYEGNEQEPLRDKENSSTLEPSRAFYKACQNGNDILIAMDNLRYAIANSITQMNDNQVHAEGKNEDEIGALYKALD